VAPLVIDQMTVGPIVPIIPNPLDDDKSDKKSVVIILIVTPSLSEGDTSINKLKIRANNEYLHPTSVDTFTYERSIFTITFDFKEEYPETMELLLPELGLTSTPPPLLYKLHDEKKYNISSPVHSPG